MYVLRELFDISIFKYYVQFYFFYGKYPFLRGGWDPFYIWTPLFMSHMFFPYPKGPKPTSEPTFVVNKTILINELWFQCFVDLIFFLFFFCLLDQTPNSAYRKPKFMKIREKFRVLLASLLSIFYLRNPVLKENYDR